MSETPEILIIALRQYRHNTDNSSSIDRPKKGFVIAFDYDETCKIVKQFENLIKHAEDAVWRMERHGMGTAKLDKCIQQIKKRTGPQRK